MGWKGKFEIPKVRHFTLEVCRLTSKRSRSYLWSTKCLFWSIHIFLLVAVTLGFGDTIFIHLLSMVLLRRQWKALMETVHHPSCLSALRPAHGVALWYLSTWRRIIHNIMHIPNFSCVPYVVWLVKFVVECVVWTNQQCNLQLYVLCVSSTRRVACILIAFGSWPLPSPASPVATTLPSFSVLHHLRERSSNMP